MSRGGGTIIEWTRRRHKIIMANNTSSDAPCGKVVCRESPIENMARERGTEDAGLLAVVVGCLESVQGDSSQVQARVATRVQATDVLPPAVDQSRQLLEQPTCEELANAAFLRGAVANGERQNDGGRRRRRKAHVLF